MGSPCRGAPGDLLPIYLLAPACHHHMSVAFTLPTDLEVKRVLVVCSSWEETALAQRFANQFWRGVTQYARPAVFCTRPGNLDAGYLAGRTFDFVVFLARVSGALDAEIRRRMRSAYAPDPDLNARCARAPAYTSNPTDTQP